jgi:hypothetical protein
MKRATLFFRELSASPKLILTSLLVGLSAGASVYLGVLQRHFFSKRYLLYAILISIAVTLLVAWLRKCLLARRFAALPRGMRITALVFTVLMSLVVLANTRIQPIYYLLPDTQMKVRIPIGDVPQDQESVRLLWVETGQGTVYYENMHFEGEWERVAKNILFAPNQEVTITWQGKAGAQPEIAFRMTRYDQPVFVSWNGVEKEYNLNQPKVPNVLIETPLDIPLIYKLPFIIAFCVSCGFVIFSLLVILGTWHPQRRQKKQAGKYAWLLYMLPMTAVWGFTLLVFWPGVMSNDSMALWIQNLSGVYSDWQSALYAFGLAVLMKIWYSPALVVILQILLLSLLTAWGLKTLEDSGVPRWPLWIVSFLFALSPVNNQLIIALWRDIPYAMAMLWLTILVLKIFLSRGESLKGWGWVWLGLSGFLIAILRQNGIPVAFALLIALPVIYRKYWKQAAGSLLLCLLVFLAVKGPLYTWLNVDRTKSGQSNLILLHHIAAHLNAGTPLEPEERAYLDSFLPVDEWDYFCCYVGTISYDKDFERQAFLDSSAENRKLALDLFLRDPWVDVEHTFCSGELVWRYHNNQCYMKSIHGFNSWVPGEVSWIIPNEVGLKDDSRIPALVQPYVDMLRAFGFRDDFLVIYLRPALYLYLAGFCVAALLLRRRDYKALLVIFPSLLQSAILFLVSYAPAIRYQYSIYLVGTLLLVLPFLPDTDAEKSN